MKYSVTDAQRKALQARFGELLDVEKEIAQALDYAINFHTGRPYKNFGKYLWNWLRRSEERLPRQAKAARTVRTAQVTPAQAPPLSRTELEGLLQDESPEIRRMAEEELRFRGVRTESVQHRRVK